MIRPRLHFARRLAPLASGSLLALLLSALPGSARASDAPPGAASPVPDTRALTLAQAIELARTRAPMVHAAFARIESAQAGVDKSSAAHLPTLSAQGAGTAFTTNGQVYSGGLVSAGGTDSYLLAQATLNLQWSLYDFGHTASSVEASESRVSAAQLSARDSEQTAMAEAAVAFYTLLADDALIASAGEVRAERERIVEITHRLAQAGFRTQVDDTRAQVGLSVAQLDVTAAEAARDNDAVALASALMLDPATVFQLETPAPLRVDEIAATVDVTRVRRGVQAAAARLDEARKEVTTARRAHLPVLAANAAASVLYVRDESTTAGQSASTHGGTELAQAGLSLTVPLFDPTLNANVKVAEGSLSEAEAHLEEVTQGVRAQASRALREVRNAGLLLEQARRLGTAASAVLGAVEERYAKGFEAPTALADAQREDALARVAIVRARLAVDVATVRLLEGVSRVDELRQAQ